MQSGGDEAREQAEPEHPHRHDDDGNPDAQPGERMVECDPVEMVGRQISCVLPHIRLIGRAPLVEPHVAQLHAPEPDLERTVRIVHGVGRGVVLAMHRHPLTRAHARGDPDDRPKGDRSRAAIRLP